MIKDFDIDAVLDAVVAQANIEKQAQRIAEYHKERRRYIKQKSFAFFANAKTCANIKKYDNNLSFAQVMQQGIKADALAKFRPERPQVHKDEFSKERTHAEFIFAKIFDL